MVLRFRDDHGLKRLSAALCAPLHDQLPLRGPNVRWGGVQHGHFGFGSVLTDSGAVRGVPHNYLLMLTGILAASYGLSALGILSLFVRVRRLDNEMEDYSKLRDVDFTYEAVEKESLPKKCLVLLKVAESAGVPRKLGGGGEERLVYSRVVSFSNLMDKAMFYKVRGIRVGKVWKRVSHQGCE